MKILVFLILIFQIKQIFTFDLCISNPKKLGYGGQCTHHSDCQMPLYCGSKGQCTNPIDNDKSVCADSRECGPYRTCLDSKCKDILYVGDKCNDYSYCYSSTCIKGVCAVDDKDCCVSQETCKFNSYCSLESNDAKNATGQCKPVGSDGFKCTIDNQCPITHSCIDNKCQKKYSKPLGSSCQSNKECMVFSGHRCDSTSKKCIINNSLLKKCQSSNDCGESNMCMCRNEGDNVCVEVQVGALKSDNCLNYLNSFQSCMIRERCLHNTPRCPKCYQIWMSYQYECFYINQFYRSGQDYYKSFWQQSTQKKLPVQQQTQTQTQSKQNSPNLIIQI